MSGSCVVVRVLTVQGAGSSATLLRSLKQLPRHDSANAGRLLRHLDAQIQPLVAAAAGHLTPAEQFTSSAESQQQPPQHRSPQQQQQQSQQSQQQQQQQRAGRASKPSAVSISFQHFQDLAARAVGSDSKPSGQVPVKGSGKPGPGKSREHHTPHRQASGTDAQCRHTATSAAAAAATAAAAACGGSSHSGGSGRPWPLPADVAAALQAAAGAQLQSTADTAVFMSQWQQRHEASLLTHSFAHGSVAGSSGSGRHDRVSAGSSKTHGLAALYRSDGSGGAERGMADPGAGRTQAGNAGCVEGESDGEGDVCVDAGRASEQLMQRTLLVARSLVRVRAANKQALGIAVRAVGDERLLIVGM
ncbi:MAG: hypothetical protein WDW38_006984 [Sanguina aurantia]